MVVRADDDTFLCDVDRFCQEGRNLNSALIVERALAGGTCQHSYVLTGCFLGRRQLVDFFKELFPLFQGIDRQTAIKASGQDKRRMKFISELAGNDDPSFCIQIMLVFRIIQYAQKPGTIFMIQLKSKKLLKMAIQRQSELTF